MAQMVAHQFSSDRSQRFVHRGDLRHHVGAISILLDHFLQPADLAFDPPQPFQVARLDLRIDGDGLAAFANSVRLNSAAAVGRCRGSCHRWLVVVIRVREYSGIQRRSRRLFVDDAHGAQRHRRARDDRVEQESKAGIQHARGDRNADHIVDERPEQILAHRAHRAARQRDRIGHGAEVGTHERDIARLDRDVRPRADRDADVGLRERRRVVDPVADHRDDMALALPTRDLARLLLGQQLRRDVVDPRLVAR